MTLQPPDAGWWQCLAEVFGLGKVQAQPGYVTRGDMGEIWDLRTSLGRWAVKVAFPWAPTDPRPADVEFQLKAAAAGVCLPAPVLTSSGNALVPVGDRHVRVYEWVELGPRLSVPVSAEIAAEVGRLLGVINSLGLPATGSVDEWYWAVPSREEWLGLCQQSASAGAPWAEGLRRVQLQVAELSHLVEPPEGPLVIAHRDFEPSNVFPVISEAGLVVLDWENAGPLHAVQELGCAVAAWTTADGRCDRAAARALVHSYHDQAGKSLDLSVHFMFSAFVATTVNYLRVMAETALGDDLVQRRYAEGRLSFLLDRGLEESARTVASASRALGL